MTHKRLFLCDSYGCLLVRHCRRYGYVNWSWEYSHCWGNVKNKSWCDMTTPASWWVREGDDRCILQKVQSQPTELNKLNVRPDIQEIQLLWYESLAGFRQTWKRHEQTGFLKRRLVWLWSGAAVQAKWQEQQTGGHTPQHTGKRQIGNSRMEEKREKMQGSGGEAKLDLHVEAKGPSASRADR